MSEVVVLDEDGLSLADADRVRQAYDAAHHASGRERGELLTAARQLARSLPVHGTDDESGTTYQPADHEEYWQAVRATRRWRRWFVEAGGLSSGAAASYLAAGDADRKWRRRQARIRRNNPLEEAK